MSIDPVLAILERIGASYALVGGHALALRGYPRATVDIDLLTTDATVLETSTWSDLAAAGGRIECRRGDHEDPLAGVAHVELPDFTDVDVIVPRWKWEAEVIARAEPLPFGSGSIPVPLASDLILLKLAAGGPLDLRDAAALLAIGDRAVLVPQVERRLPEVVPDVTQAWQDVLAIEL